MIYNYLLVDFLILHKLRRAATKLFFESVRKIGRVVKIELVTYFGNRTFDNSQHNADLIYIFWRDFEGNFGRDLIREHFQNSDYHH